MRQRAEQIERIGMIRLPREHLPAIRIIRLDDERLVERGVAGLNVLHAEKFSEVAEDALSVDAEAKAARVNERSAKTRVIGGRFAARFGIDIERQLPRRNVC